jgi:hypothetical protein
MYGMHTCMCAYTHTRGTARTRATNLCALTCSLVESTKILEDRAASTIRLKDYPEDGGSRFLQILLIFTRAHGITFQNTPALCSSQILHACCFHACCIAGPCRSAWGSGVQSESDTTSEWKLESVQYTLMAW